MSIRVLADGADGYRLLSANSDLAGWVRGRAIGVSGFADENASTSAAIRSYAVLGAWLKRQHLHPLPELSDDPARLIHDGAIAWAGRTKPFGESSMLAPTTYLELEAL